MKKIRIESDITGRGRNGWIKVKAANVWHLLGINEVHIEFRSKRIGDTAPLLLKGNPKDMLKLFNGITKQIREGNKKHEKID